MAHDSQNPLPPSPGPLSARGATDPIIELRGVTKRYGGGTESGVVALAGVDLRVHRGEMVALAGRSGAGVSSLMNILACVDTPTTGCYLLNGVETTRISRRAMARVRADLIGTVSSTSTLIESSTVFDNVTLPVLYSGESVDDRRARPAIASVDLGDYCDLTPEHLSPSQRRRALLARALVNNPPIVLLDRPARPVDPQLEVDLVCLLKELNEQGHTIIFCPQELRLSHEYADRVITLENGMTSNAETDTSALFP
jgi:putative ABC transport system ATP-binding protein